MSDLKLSQKITAGQEEISRDFVPEWTWSFRRHDLAVEAVTLEAERDELKAMLAAMERERDELWCRALTVLDSKYIQQITEMFLRLREQATAQQEQKE